MRLSEYTLLALEVEKVLQAVHVTACSFHGSDDAWKSLDSHLDSYLSGKLCSEWYERFRTLWANAAADAPVTNASDEHIKKKSVFYLMEGIPRGFHTDGLLCVLAETAPPIEDAS